jgi:PAS domain-containing protein
MERLIADVLQNTFDSMIDTVFILDANVPPAILECNEAASAIFGYDKAVMLGRTTDFQSPPVSDAQVPYRP